MGVVADERPDDGDRNVPLSVFKRRRFPWGLFALAETLCHNTKTPHALASLPTFLLSIPNGDHSFNALNNKLGLQYRDLLEHLKDKDIKTPRLIQFIFSSADFAA